MNKRITFPFLLLFIAITVSAQLKVSPSGHVGINTSPGANVFNERDLPVPLRPRITIGMLIVHHLLLLQAIARAN